jgi:hypothetical protein
MASSRTFAKIALAARWFAGQPQSDADFAFTISSFRLTVARSKDVSAALQAGRAILAELVADHPDFAQWKKDLAWLDAEMAAHDKRPVEYKLHAIVGYCAWQAASAAPASLSLAGSAGGRSFPDPMAGTISEGR